MKIGDTVRHINGLPVDGTVTAIAWHDVYATRQRTAHSVQVRWDNGHSEWYPLNHVYVVKND